MTTTTLNGIDVEAVRELATRTAADPASGVAEFEVSTRWQGGTRAETRVEQWRLGGERLDRGFTILSDEPPQLAGAATAPNPQEILMAGLNSCMLVGYVACCALEGIELEQLEIRTHGALDLRGFLGVDPEVPPGYEAIRYEVRIRGGGTPEQFQRIHETVMATSPNFWNVSRPVRLVPTLVLD